MTADDHVKLGGGGKIPEGVMTSEQMNACEKNAAWFGRVLYCSKFECFGAVGGAEEPIPAGAWSSRRVTGVMRARAAALTEGDTQQDAAMVDSLEE